MDNKITRKMTCLDCTNSLSYLFYGEVTKTESCYESERLRAIFPTQNGLSHEKLFFPSHTFRYAESTFIDIDEYKIHTRIPLEQVVAERLLVLTGTES